MTIAECVRYKTKGELRTEDTMQRRDFLVGGIAAAVAGLSRSVPAFAQAAFPAKQIHIVVPTSAGGVHDVIGRIWADRVRSSLGTIVVENRAGGGSSIALNYVAQQPADGHTLLVGSTSTLVLREGGNNRAYDALKDIRSVSVVATTSTSIAVHPSLPVTSVQELIAYAKANPGKLSYGSGGVGAITHITPELFTAGRRPRHPHVPYRGIAPAMNDLPAQIKVIFPNITSQVVAPIAPAGCASWPSMRRRASTLRPTSRPPEKGLANFVSQIFFGVFALAGTPKGARADQQRDPDRMGG